MFMLWVHVFGCTWLVWVVTLLGEKLRRKEEQVTTQRSQHTCHDNNSRLQTLVA